jgi:hypothetical protein
MARVHATSDGDVPFTAKEERDRDIEEAAWHAGRSVREMNELRVERNALLISSDYTQLDDIPQTDVDKARWVAYRQELRDLPMTTVDPEKPIWPAVPKP